MIHHHLASAPTDLLTFLDQELGLGAEKAQWLVDLGAVYVNHNRERKNRPLSIGDYIRTHSDPRRFPVGEVKWQEAVFYETEDFVVLHKPNCIPTHATVDNWRENATAEISKLLGAEVFVTHRLDVATSGLLILAKTKKFQREFNNALRDGHVKKHYVAHVLNPPEARGLVTHYMEVGTHLPKKVSREPLPDWLECRLEILDVFPHSKDQGHLVRVRLLTGRTHQIRAQLSDLGSPILGDKLYGGDRPWSLHEKIGLTAVRLEFRLSVFDNPQVFELPEKFWR